MAAYGNVTTAQYGHGHPAATYGSQVAAPIQAPTAPAGTFVPGTKIQVGSHRVIIQKYLSEGGFAHVYLVKLPQPVDGTDLAVLKRVAVPDKEALRGMRTEVECMKRIRGHRKVVTYIDSHASELKGGGYEVFLLMEYCNGGGLIDFMNTRLQHRLTEPEILHIFTDVAEGLACMHYLKPPLLHRDLKVENVLITAHGSKKTFKLCDFGSATAPKPAPQSIVECRLIDEDIQRHTTMQYRSPEMVDVYRKQPIDEKSDIWALGVFLYKLCYYTTPFEDQGQLAILNASYRFPSYPVFSDRLKKLIASMLLEHPRSRPTIYQVLREACSMQGREVPIKDIYSGRKQLESSGTEVSPASARQGHTTPVPGMGAVYSPPPIQQGQAIPDIVPMRRGRPTSTSQPPAPHASKPSPSPMRVTNGDPFAALDSKPGRQAEADELSSRFPTLDQFSLLHEQGAKFEFDSPTSPSLDKKEFHQQVTDRLADDAFLASRPKPEPTQPTSRQSSDYNRVRPVVGGTERHDLSPPPGSVNKPASAPPPSEMSRASAIISSNPELQAIASSPPKSVAQTPPSKPAMVSTGTMTGTPPLAGKPLQEYPQIHRFQPTDQHRSSSLPRQQNSSGTGQYQMDTAYSSRPAGTPRLSSLQQRPSHGRHSSSTRPSLEGGRPSLEMLEPLAKSTSGRPRPSSTFLESNLDYLREREAAPRPLRSPGLPSTRFPETAVSPGLIPQEDTAIESNVDFLRSMEDSDPKRKDKSHKHHGKRPSLGSLSGTKNILAGKFGDAFKRFEGNNNPGPQRTPSPLKELDRHELTPIAGSEATDGRSDDGHGEPEMTPEMRRELEAQSLAEEERRVEAAAAEYRRRVAAREAGESTHPSDTASGSAPLPKSIGGVSRAVSIQNRVQNLLDESQKSSAQKTASGYGKFTDSAAPTDDADQGPGLPPRPAVHGTGTGTGRSVSSSVTGSARPITAVASGSMEANITAAAAAAAVTRGRPASTAPQESANERRPLPPPRPQPAPKPTHLNNIPTGGSRARSPSKSQRPPPPSSSSTSVASAGLSSNSGGGGGGPRMSAEQLIALDLPGQAPGTTATLLDMSPREKEDYVRDFSKRFPSLSAIEMVERDLSVESGGGGGGGGGGSAERKAGR